MAEEHFDRGKLINEHKSVPITQEYNMENARLGEGTFGTCCKAKHKKGGNTIAIKSIIKKNLKDAEKFKAEIHIMKELDHPNIVRLYETYEDAKCLYLVMELCEGGELFDKIIDEGNFDEVKAAHIMKQILGAIFYMHKNKIVHRDLKPENFLLETKAADSPLKVIDFGLSCKFPAAGKMLSTKAGTPYYVAPEVLAGSYDHKSDVWSCGVMMYVLLCGYPPFYGDKDSEILAMVRKGEFDFPEEEWGDISQEAKTLIGKLLKKDFKTRVDAEAALADPWFKTNKEQSAKVGSKVIANMKSFQTVGKFKKVALTAIARSLPAAKIKQLTDVFKSLDVNGDGTLTYQEVLDTIKKEGMAAKDIPEDLEKIMKNIDSDGSGQIDYTEFVAATIDRKMVINEENAWIAFRQFDLDGDGKITAAELESVLGADGVGDHYDRVAIEKMIKEADSNGDGMIDFEEFKAHMKT